MRTANQNKIIEVNVADFQREVIQRSHQVPVIVDFWAPWCGPCRMLGPVLERLAIESNSNFVLAKVNSDHNPQLSMEYGVRGIPAVKAFANGRVVDEFIGALPEPRVRQFIQRVTAGFRPQSQGTVQPRSRNSDPKARLDRARQLLRQGKGCQAVVQLKEFPAGPSAGQGPQAAAARKLLPLAQFICQMSRGSGYEGPKELESLYRQAAAALQRREFAAAMYNLLAILNKDRGHQDGRAQKVMVGLFELLGENDSLTQAYRQQVDAVLAG